MLLYICAVAANSKAVSDPGLARKLGHISVRLSSAGMIISVITVVVVVYLITVRNRDPPRHSTATSGQSSAEPDSCAFYSYGGSCYCSGHAYNGTCYRFKTPIKDRNYSSCFGGTKSADGYYCYSDVCPDYGYSGTCYKHREYVGIKGNCSTGGVWSPDNYFCYYSSCPKYEHTSSCYKYQRYVSSKGYCSGVRSPDRNYCYYTACPVDDTHRSRCYRYTSVLTNAYGLKCCFF